MSIPYTCLLGYPIIEHTWSSVSINKSGQFKKASGSLDVNNTKQPTIINASLSSEWGVFQTSTAWDKHKLPGRAYSSPAAAGPTTNRACKLPTVRGFVLHNSPCPLYKLSTQAAAMPTAYFIRASFLCPFLRKCCLNEIIGISLCYACSPSQKKKTKGWMCFLSSYAISKQQSFRALCLNKAEIHILLLKNFLQESNMASALSSNYLSPVPASFNALVMLLFT